MRLLGKVSIITGAGRGIGHATVEKFLAEGSIVIACDIDPSLIEQVNAEIKAVGGSGTAIVVDVTDPVAIAQMLDSVITE